MSLLQIRSSRAPYRRAGIEFGREPLVLGPEHMLAGLDGARQLLTLLTDPVLTVKRRAMGSESPEFIVVTAAEVAEVAVAAALLEQALAAETTAPEAAERVAAVLGDWAMTAQESDSETKLPNPGGPDEGIGAGAPAGDELDGKGTVAKGAAPVDPHQALSPSTGEGEQSREGAAANGETSNPVADEEQKPVEAPRPPVVDAHPAPAPTKPAPTGRKKPALKTAG